MGGRERFNRRMNGAFMDEDLEKEDAALPLVVDQARQRLSGLNYPEASLDVGGSHAIELQPVQLLR
jgi:hypothetical protein